jgi:cell wall assembly regulator SMI1
VHDEARAIWDRLILWAKRWDLPEPRVSAGWNDLPPSFLALARDGWIERPLVEPPASARDESALVQESALSLPDDLRALHAIHDGSFAPLLPHGMTLFPYEATRTTWRSLAVLADEFADEHATTVGEGTHLACVYHRQWLPIAASDDTNLFLDFAPGPAGTNGQVLLQINECEYAVVGGSTLDFLSRWLRLLDDGRVRFDAQYGYAVPSEALAVEQLLREVRAD